MTETAREFTIVIVTLNSGSALQKTVESVLEQSYGDFEILIKDGGSKDGSLEAIAALTDERIRIICSSDKGIYDAMNQAVSLAVGRYIIFLNAGDYFYSSDVLETVAGKNLPESNCIAYGDTYFRLSDSLSLAPPAITGSVCYRNIPCHQAIFYSADTLRNRGFDTNYRIRADFEHFNYSFFKAHCEFIYLGIPVCDYEGGGFSESKKNKKLDAEEYRRAVKTHIPFNNRFLYRLTLIVTLHKLRGALARNPFFAKKYQALKAFIYGHKG